MIVVLDSKCTLKEKAAVVRFVEQGGGRILVTVVGEETHIGLIDAEAQAACRDHFGDGRSVGASSSRAALPTRFERASARVDRGTSGKRGHRQLGAGSYRRTVLG